MYITVNGKVEELEGEWTIASFLESKKISPEAVIVELNFELPERKVWAITKLSKNDNIEVLKFMGGG